MSNEQRYYDTLKRIATEYQTSAKLRRNAGQYGCSFEEEIEMAYENIQEEAKRAIKGRRRPSGPAAEKSPRGIDYGFKLVAERGDNGFIVMQPAREENGQEFINRPASDAIRFLRGEN